MRRSIVQIAIQFVKFGIVGVTAFVIDYGLFLAFTYLFGMFYILASTLSFVISTVYNYVMSMRYVFQGKQTQTAMQQFLIFFVLSLIGLGLNQVFLWISVALIGSGAWLGKLVATFLVMIYNFVTRKIFLEDSHR